jgi:GNAT superfamily N-acetyltransferase
VLSIRPATVQDVPSLRAMICELADYERELESVEITEEQLARDGFGESPKFRALIAEWNGQPAGYAVFFQFYSTWTGRHMFLEDLFVRPQLRGKKIGLWLMAKVASIARAEGCRAMRWEVLGWNQSSIDLYKALGGEFLDDWKLVLLKDEALKNLADRSA